MEKDPLDLTNRSALSHWLWRIHNMVNGKLRSQGLLKDKNPTFASVEKVYKERIASGCVKTEFEGWDFLFSIAENHTLHKGVVSQDYDTPELRNRYNTMKPEERMIYYKRFWKSLAGSLPFEMWRECWKECDLRVSEMEARKKWIRELWRIRCCMEKKLDLVNRDKFGSLCKRLASHRSGCATRKRAKTCRKK
jgi:hypothetical protein